MIPATLKEYLKELISKQLNTSVGSLKATSVGGGSINNCYRLTINDDRKLFLKLNSSTRFPGLFEKERNGLTFLGKQNCIRVPMVIFDTTVGNNQLLLLEWIEAGTRHEDFWKKFGQQLAQLHGATHEHFGFAEDNYMGALPQDNSFTKNWTEFFIKFRLQPQIELASNKKLLQKTQAISFESLFKKLDSVFNIEKPSLLHGDLWSGNFICNDQSLPVLIDPATYFGHRSMDLAMTTLFSGFEQPFYESYHYHFAFPANYREQWEICNLYPLLIHLNLFGESYLSDISRTLKKFS
ncbi:MAG: fructosamine kinase family protein [Chitinophagales bacterium]